MLNLLFICTHNRCRSILAEAIARHLGFGFIEARSAGTAPEGQVHPLSLKYLEERRIPVQGLHSKSWDNLDNFMPDIVITVCDRAAAEACPLWLGPAARVHWGLRDPSAISDDEEARRQAFMDTIDLLQDRIGLLRHWISAETPMEQILQRLRRMGESEQGETDQGESAQAEAQ